MYYSFYRCLVTHLQVTKCHLRLSRYIVSLYQLHNHPILVHQLVAIPLVVAILDQYHSISVIPQSLLSLQHHNPLLQWVDPAHPVHLTPLLCHQKWSQICVSIIMRKHTCLWPANDIKMDTVCTCICFCSLFGILGLCTQQQYSVLCTLIKLSTMQSMYWCLLISLFSIRFQTSWTHKLHSWTDGCC